MPRLGAVFNIQGSELIFLLLIALVVLGPEKLPDAVRKFGRTYSEFKKVANGFQGELRSALDEPMRELRSTADAVRAAANFDFDADLSSSTHAAETPVTNGEPEAAEQIRPVKRDTTLNFGDPAARRRKVDQTEAADEAASE